MNNIPASNEAPEPGVLHAELTNILMKRYNKSGERAREIAGDVVNEMLAKQMSFYQNFAEPELTTDARAINEAMQKLEVHRESVIRAGATMCGYAPPNDREAWQKAALNLRKTVSEVLGLLT